MIDDKVNISDEVKAELVPNMPTVAEMVRVRVLAEAGIFKNGVQHDKGSEATITKDAALKFQALGEVEILGAAPTGESNE